jgi:hypothetical protein
VHLDERRQEPVHPSIEWNGPQRVGAKRLERTARVADRFAVEVVPHPVGDAALQAAPRRVPPADPVPGDRRGAGAPERGDEGRDVGRIVLEIRIEGDDDAAAGRAKARRERGGLPVPGEGRYAAGWAALRRLSSASEPSVEPSSTATIS